MVEMEQDYPLKRTFWYFVALIGSGLNQFMFYMDIISFCTTWHQDSPVMFSIFCKRSYYRFAVWVVSQRAVMFFASGIHCPVGSRFLASFKIFSRIS
jgi:hypothetical protein